VIDQRTAGCGWIVNLSSASSAYPALAPSAAVPTTMTVYSASKAALERMAIGLAAEVYADWIAVNTIAPVAAVVTPGAQALVGQLLREHPELVEPVECSRRPRSPSPPATRRTAPAGSCHAARSSTSSAASLERSAST
jgi:NAD(P)-dependent dehydrogenase (short-subunit alcohol dehydrogenase family)